MAALVAIFPAGAWAGAHANLRHSPGQSAAFTVVGSNGYSLYFKSEKGVLTVTASRGRPGAATISPRGRLVPSNPGNVAWNTYVALTPKDPTTIEADLGPVGKVSVAFQPSGETAINKVDLEGKTERCVGATKIVRRLGVFTGTISFQGENGYTTADVTSAPGTVGTSAFRNCTTLHHRAPRASSRQGFDASLSMGATNPSMAFFAGSNSSGSLFNVFLAEASSRLLILHQATATASSNDFVFDPAGDRASLRPPPPFSGFAAFRDPLRGPAYLRGTLAVEFPGLRARLTGPGFEPPRLEQRPTSR